jgi:hypothetical protein
MEADEAGMAGLEFAREWLSGKLMEQVKVQVFSGPDGEEFIREFHTHRREFFIHGLPAQAGFGVGWWWCFFHGLIGAKIKP